MTGVRYITTRPQETTPGAKKRKNAKELSPGVVSYDKHGVYTYTSYNTQDKHLSLIHI